MQRILRVYPSCLVENIQRPESFCVALAVEQSFSIENRTSLNVSGRKLVVGLEQLATGSQHPTGH